MWNRSTKWQRVARTASAIATLACVGVGVAWASSNTSVQRAADGLVEIARETNPDASSVFTCDVPNDLNTKVGTLVYIEDDTGAGSIVGRVVRIESGTDTDRISVLLTPDATGVMTQGGQLLGATPTKSVESAFRLLISPDIPREEAKIARDAIWPAVAKAVMPSLLNRVEEQVMDGLRDPDEEDLAIVTTIMETLRKDLAEHEEAILNRLAEKAWEIIGVWGVTEGIWRKASDAAGNKYDDVKEWVKGLWGGEEETEERERDFLSDEKKTELREALEAEVLAYWEDNRDDISKKASAAFESASADIRKSLEDKWGPKLFQNAVIPAWLAGEKEVFKAAEKYAADFARRRLLTENGSPRLLLAYALRSALEITDDPLLVIRPMNTDGQVTYRWVDSERGE